MQEQSLQNNRWIKWMGLVFVMAVLLFQNSIPVKAETVPTILKEYETNISAEGKEQIHFTVPNAPCRIMMQTVTTGGSVTVGFLEKLSPQFNPRSKKKLANLNSALSPKGKV